MTKNSLHFKIASWSCRNPKLFYMGVIGFVLLLGTLSFMTRDLYGGSSQKYRPNTADIDTQVTFSQTDDWKPVRDMNLPDGIRCRLYRKGDTSITNCYKMLNGDWVFYQSF